MAMFQVGCRKADLQMVYGWLRGWHCNEIKIILIDILIKSMVKHESQGVWKRSMILNNASSFIILLYCNTIDTQGQGKAVSLLRVIHYNVSLWIRLEFHKYVMQSLMHRRRPHTILYHSSPFYFISIKTFQQSLEMNNGDCALAFFFICEQLSKYSDLKSSQVHLI